jgi:hypothetical protein
MCEPTTILAITAAVGAASAGFSAYGDYQSAKSQNKFTERHAAQQMEEYTAQRNQEVGERVRQTRRERASMQVAGAESGLTGNSFENLLRDALGRQSQDIAVVQKQGGFTHRAISNQVKANTQTFSAIGAGLQIAKGGLAGYNAGASFNASRAQ